jgi:hypothetical protein
MRIPQRGVLAPTLFALFTLIAVGYWYIYGRERELIGPFNRFHGTPESILNAKLQLVPEERGSELRGIIVVRIKEGIENSKHLMVAPCECFLGALKYRQQADCEAQTLLIFDPAKQKWDFSLLLVAGHPKDPLRVFDR